MATLARTVGDLKSTMIRLEITAMERVVNATFRFRSLSGLEASACYSDEIVPALNALEAIRGSRAL